MCIRDRDEDARAFEPLAASDGASLNIFINAASMDDAAQAARYRGEAESLAARTRERCDELFDFVKTSVS